MLDKMRSDNDIQYHILENHVNGVRVAKHTHENEKDLDDTEDMEEEIMRPLAEEKHSSDNEKDKATTL